MYLSPPSPALLKRYHWALYRESHYHRIWLQLKHPQKDPFFTSVHSYHLPAFHTFQLPRPKYMRLYKRCLKHVGHQMKSFVLNWRTTLINGIYSQSIMKIPYTIDNFKDHVMFERCRALCTRYKHVTLSQLIAPPDVVIHQLSHTINSSCIWKRLESSGYCLNS